jgi:hypothetical protein
MNCSSGPGIRKNALQISGPFAATLGTEFALVRPNIEGVTAEWQL